jgi:signal transduction histidine kinase
MLMPPTPEDTPPHAYGPGDQLRHDLKSPLTTIHARAQLLGRAVQRASSLTDEESMRMLAGLVEIQAAVREIVAVIDAMVDEPNKHADEVADELP